MFQTTNQMYILLYIYTNSFLAGHITWMIPSRHLFLSCTLTRKAQQPRGLQPESYVNTLLIDAITWKRTWLTTSQLSYAYYIYIIHDDIVCLVESDTSKLIVWTHLPDATTTKQPTPVSALRNEPRLVHCKGDGGLWAADPPGAGVTVGKCWAWRVWSVAASTCSYGHGYEL